MATMTPTEEIKEFIKLRDRFYEAANELNRFWGFESEHISGTDFCEGYPKYLPSFDEFVFDLMGWRDGEMTENGAGLADKRP